MTKNTDIKIGDTVIMKYDSGYNWAGIRTKVIGVRIAKSFRSGMGIRVALRKSYYDSNYFTIIEPYTETIMKELKTSEIF